jgi:hypothetical protein
MRVQTQEPTWEGMSDKLSENISVLVQSAVMILTWNMLTILLASPVTYKKRCQTFNAVSSRIFLEPLGRDSFAPCAYGPKSVYSGGCCNRSSHQNSKRCGSATRWFHNMNGARNTRYYMLTYLAFLVIISIA